MAISWHLNQVRCPVKSLRLNFWHWNLNVHAFIKVNNIEIICLSERFLDSKIPLNDERLYIKGYLMIRADHPSNTKRGSFLIYYKEYSSLIRKIDKSKPNEGIVTKKL